VGNGIPAGEAGVQEGNQEKGTAAGPLDTKTPTTTGGHAHNAKAPRTPPYTP
jgi:hypothetical protein